MLFGHFDGILPQLGMVTLIELVLELLLLVNFDSLVRKGRVHLDSLVTALACILILAFYRSHLPQTHMLDVTLLSTKGHDSRRLADMPLHISLGSLCIRADLV